MKDYLSKEFIEDVVNLLDEKQAYDIVVLDLSEESAIAEYYIIATGKNTRHAASLGDDVEEFLAERNIPMHHKEGHREGEWVVLDYVDFIVHIFNQDKRDYYRIKDVYKNAKILFEK